MKIVRPCWRSSSVDEDRRDDDRLLWCKDIGRHVAGDFSMAVVQANSLLEDSCQIQSGPLISNDSANKATLVGVFDGHGGPETSRFVTDNLFQNLKKFASEQGGVSVDVIKRAYSATEESFLSTVKKQWLNKPQIASVGSCCLVGVLCGGMLYIANAGDSRAVLGSWSRGERELSAIQMSTEHNASIESVRDELKSLHPDDPQIVVLKHKVWRVKGIIQISRSIGDAYLKDTEFNREPLAAKFRLPEPFQKSILSAEPSIVAHKLCPQDQFIIFASDGLWEHMSNQEAVDMVHNSPRNGVAKRLIRAALKEAAKKREMRYSDLKKIGRGVRRHFHDDISVIVLYLDPVLIRKANYNGPALSLSRCGDSVQTDSTTRKF